MKKVHLDFGHGGTDPGASGNGLVEKELTLAIGKKVENTLKTHELTVVSSRTTDTFVSLATRSMKANSENVDIFVSIHINAFKDPGANGVETFSYPGSKEGAKLAKTIQDELVRAKLFKSDRGVKTANFHVLRETKAPAALVELGFITNSSDAGILRTRQEDIAKAVAEGILGYLGMGGIGRPKPITPPGIPIISKPTATVEQLKEWARKKGANQLFIDLAPSFYALSNHVGVNPLVTYTQSAKETGYLKFGGVLNASYKNPCGLKTNAGGGDKDSGAHHRFQTWEDGIKAQVDHLALYAGAPGYPKKNTSDPRHFSFIRGKATTVEALSGNWAPSKSYGADIVKMIKEIEATVATTKPKVPINGIKVNLLGKQAQVKGILKNGTNYVSINGKDIPLRDVFESMGFEVSWDAIKGVVIK